MRSLEIQKANLFQRVAANKKGITSREGDNGTVYFSKKNVITILVWGNAEAEMGKMKCFSFWWIFIEMQGLAAGRAVGYLEYYLYTYT